MFFDDGGDSGFHGSAHFFGLVDVSDAGLPLTFEFDECLLHTIINRLLDFRFSKSCVEIYKKSLSPYPKFPETYYPPLLSNVASA